MNELTDENLFFALLCFVASLVEPIRRTFSLGNDAKKRRIVAKIERRHHSDRTADRRKSTKDRKSFGRRNQIAVGENRADRSVEFDLRSFRKQQYKELSELVTKNDEKSGYQVGTIQASINSINTRIADLRDLVRPQLSFPLIARRRSSRRINLKSSI